MSKVISIFAAAPPFGPPLTRTCASCCSWNPEEQLCENLVSGVPPEDGCDQHETHAEFWHGVENPRPETAGMRHALKLIGDIRKSIDDHAKRQAVYKTLVDLVQQVLDDPTTEARSQRLVGFVNLMTPVIATGLQSWGAEECRRA